MVSNKVMAQIEQKSIILEPYYGYSLAYSYFKSLDYDISSKYSNFGPVGLRCEFLMTNLVGVGIDMNYRKSTFSGEYTNDNETYKDNYKNSEIRVMARINFHFIHNKNIDLYSGFGAGYKAISREFWTTNPYAEPSDFSYTPLTIRLSAGFRYFFTKNLGIGTEIGIGGSSFVNLGFTAKF